MDAKKAEDLRAVAEIQVKNATAYADARQKSGLAERDLKIILAAHLAELRQNKKNLGVDMAILMLIEVNDIAKSLYSEWMAQEAKYKGLEKLLEAYSSKLITEQSLMKYQGQGERWGA